METNDAMRAMVARSGLTSRGVSVAAGRSPSWLSATLARPGDSAAGVLAAIAAPCGYALALVPSDRVPGGALVIDPAGPRG